MPVSRLSSSPARWIEVPDPAPFMTNVPYNVQRDHHAVDAADANDGREVALHVVGHVGHERRGGERAGTSHTNGVAVWRRLGDGVDADHAAGAGPVLDHDRLL